MSTEVKHLVDEWRAAAVCYPSKTINFEDFVGDAQKTAKVLNLLTLANFAHNFSRADSDADWYMPTATCGTRRIHIMTAQTFKQTFSLAGPLISVMS